MLMCIILDKGETVFKLRKLLVSCYANNSVSPIKDCTTPKTVQGHAMGYCLSMCPTLRCLRNLVKQMINWTMTCDRCLGLAKRGHVQRCQPPCTSRPVIVTLRCDGWSPHRRACCCRSCGWCIVHQHRNCFTYTLSLMCKRRKTKKNYTVSQKKFPPLNSL